MPTETAAGAASRVAACDASLSKNGKKTHHRFFPLSEGWQSVLHIYTYIHAFIHLYTHTRVGTYTHTICTYMPHGARMVRHWINPVSSSFFSSFGRMAFRPFKYIRIISISSVFHVIRSCIMSYVLHVTVL
jgi:hypothetical protein